MARGACQCKCELTVRHRCLVHEIRSCSQRKLSISATLQNLEHAAKLVIEFRTEPLNRRSAAESKVYRLRRTRRAESSSRALMLLKNDVGGLCPYEAFWRGIVFGEIVIEWRPPTRRRS
jgi:hypothetical protein